MTRLIQPLTLAAAFGTTGLVSAQHSGWIDGQINATMCQWQQPRAAVVRDTVYVDGGYLWWTPGMATGEYGIPTQDGNPLGLILTLNFSTPFNASRNLSTVFGTLSKAPNGAAANNLAPNYFDGAMLANDHEWFLYGGLLTKTNAFSTPPENEVLGYQLSSYGVEKPSFRPGFIRDELPDGVSRYIAFGGAANAPSENKAWYFGGMIGDEWQETFFPTGNVSLNPANHSNTLIQLDMTTQQQETWTNITLPDDIRGRAGPELVWVPVGEQGILVVLGGVLYPGYAQGSTLSANEAESIATGDDFMSIIDIYDIANDRWFKQPTTGGPAARTRGCAVVAPARDYSSLNIYWYGGYDGLDPTVDFDDDVWVLSLPSFIWMKVASGSPRHARAGHKCFKPYPDQMFVIGGSRAQPGESLRCLDGGVIETFNLTSGEWLDSYHPSVYHDYGVPEVIHMAIGGDWAGGATVLSPTPTGWADPDLASVFATAYETDKITTYYPYPVAEEGLEGSDTPRPTAPSSSWPSWATPVLVVLLVLLLAAIGFFVWFVLRRRKQMSKRDGTEVTDESGNRIISWIKGQPSEKAQTVTTEDTPISPIPRSQAPAPLPPPVVHYEMADTSAPVEMMDTSPRVELGDTGLNHGEVINKYTHFGGNQGSVKNSSYNPGDGSSVAAHSVTAVSPMVGATGSPTTSVSTPAGRPSLLNRAESPNPSMNDRPSTPPKRMVSGASALTTATGHIRHDSVSTMGEGPVDRSGTPLQPPGQAPFSAPVSPPQPSDEFSPNRMATPNIPPAPGSPSPLRRSVFYENEADMGEGDNRRP